MDAAGRAPIRFPLIDTALCFLLFFCCPMYGSAQAFDPNVERAERLLAAEHWQDVVNFVSTLPHRSPDLDYCYGTALAHLERWDEARRAFEEGSRMGPGDKRFPTELAGVAFKQKKYDLAKKHLTRALRMDAHDSYPNDFLGTIYFLEGNTDAALKYWNRLGKPEISAVRLDPEPKVDAELLDRVFLFSPASILTLSQLNATRARMDALQIFPVARFDLEARDDGKFNILFRNWERDGWGPNRYQALFGVFRGLPFQTVYPEYYDLHHQAINIVSLFRWDAQKRRVLATLSGPLHQNPKRRYGISADLRGENWNVLSSFTGAAQSTGSLNLRREAIAAEVRSIESGRWDWSATVEFSHRDFRSIVIGSAFIPSLLAKGYQLKQASQVNLSVWQWPERRMRLTATGAYELGRVWSQPSDSFLKLRPSAAFRWFPRAKGDDYEIQQDIRAGKTLGNVPFDELSILGVERDNDLWMRAHIGTRDGRKGSAPLGREFFLSNWEMAKNVYGNGIINIKVGPFLDTGKITDPSPGLGSHKWLWDTGLQATFRILGANVGFSYGKDLRSGNNAFYVTMKR